MPVALITVAYVFIQELEWSPLGAYALATLIGIILSGSILAAAWMKLQSGMEVLERSREELGRNIAWIKSSLRSAATRSDAERAMQTEAPPRPR
jgi:hypothetical protein